MEIVGADEENLEGLQNRGGLIDDYAKIKTALQTTPLSIEISAKRRKRSANYTIQLEICQDAPSCLVVEGQTVLKDEVQIKFSLPQPMVIRGIWWATDQEDYQIGRVTQIERATFTLPSFLGGDVIDTELTNVTMPKQTQPFIDKGVHMFSVPILTDEVSFYRLHFKSKEIDGHDTYWNLGQDILLQMELYGGDYNSLVEGKVKKDNQIILLQF